MRGALIFWGVILGIAALCALVIGLYSISPYLALGIFIAAMLIMGTAASWGD